MPILFVSWFGQATLAYALNFLTIDSVALLLQMHGVILFNHYRTDKY
jgi:hypothetical protein